jgi:lysozyme
MLNGIDISSWQAGISVADVPSDFVIVKATEGTSYTSPNMHEQADATLSSGKLLGFYHFARTGDACEEADFFCNTVADYLPSAALFLDYEADALGNGSGWAYNFLSHVKERTGQVPGVYMSKSVCRSQDWSTVASEGYPLWAAQYANNDRMGYTDSPWTDGYGFGAWSHPTIYQYSSSGDLDGYSGSLDINLFYGDRDDWKELFQGGDTMTFDNVWFDETLNSKRTPKDEAYTTPANLLWETANEVHENKTKLEALESKVDKLLAALAK